MSKKIKGTLALTFATVIWGSAFTAQSVGMDYIEPFTFQAVRCFLAVLFLIPVIFLLDRRKTDFFRSWQDPKLWKTGFFCGTALFVAAGLQQVGLVYTGAGKAGFITAMYIVLVPILGLFLGRRPSPVAWLCVLTATVGLYLLSCAGVTEVNIGDIFLTVCALAFAVQITLIDRLSGDLEPLRLNCVQSLVCAALSAGVMIFTENPSLPNILDCSVPLLYAGVLSMGVAYTLQIIGQRQVEPTSASLIMSLESVFAVLFGWLLLQEKMAAYEKMGCCLVFASVVLSQIPIRTKKHG